MKKIYVLFRNLIVLVLLGLSSLLFLHCGATEEKTVSQTPIIPNLLVITLTQPANDAVTPLTITATSSFQYSAAKNVKHMILFVCAGTGCAANAVSNGKVDLTNVDAGNSTSKSMGMTSTLLSEMYTINGSVFTSTQYTGTGEHQWFIIGYDSGGNLIAASPAWSFVW